MNTNTALSLSALPSAVLDRTAITRAVEIAANVVEKRTTYPILANIRLTGDGNTMFVTATNLDMEIVVAVPAAADDGFDVTIPADLLKSLLKGAPKAEHVAFEMPPIAAEKKDGCAVFDGEVAADFDKVRYDLVALHPDAFPALKAPSHNEARRFALPGSVLLDALNSVSKAISNEETRYYLNGVCVEHYNAHNGNGGLRFTATDGHRLLGQVVDLPEGATELPRAIWPKQFVYLLQKLMKGKNCPESVSIMADEKLFRASFGDVTITSKLIEGTFPDVDRVTPRHNDKIVSASITSLQEANAAVALIGKPGGVKFEFNAGRCTLSKLDTTNGRARMSISVEQDFDDDFEIGFNARYFEEILDVASVGGDDLTLAFNNSQAPTLITGDKAGWYAVLMPMRT